MFDASSYNWTADENSFRFNHTDGTGTNRILVCGVWSQASAGNGVTAMSMIAVIPGNHPISYWWLASPTSGANSVAVSGAGIYFILNTSCVSSAGASQSTPSNLVPATAVPTL